MHTKLTPRLAAELAQSAYGLLDTKASVQSNFGLPSVRQNVDFQQQASGRSGGYILNRESGFAAMGIGKGRYSGDAIITIRGTEFTSGHDWATNAQIGLTGCSGSVIKYHHKRVCRDENRPIDRLSIYLRYRDQSYVPGGVPQRRSPDR